MATIDLHANRSDAERSAPHAGTCACGGHDDALPELDVQTIPHAIRHAAIFGALDGLRRGSALVLSATHNPLPLLAQLEERRAGAFDVTYLDEGPVRWRLRIERTAS